MGVFAAIMNFRINIDPEFQGWILLFFTLNAFWVYCLPCYCAGQPFAVARKFASELMKRLPLYMVVATFFNAGMMFLVIQWLPDWTMKTYIKTGVKFLAFLAKHVMQCLTSMALIVVACFVFAFKDRILKMLGLDHRTMFRCKLRDCLSCGVTNVRAIELYLWKVEDLPSAQMFAANNIFLETYLGYNEPMKTRVHNNAGSQCLLKETIQLNFDETDEDESLFLFVKNQKVMGSSELGRLEMSPNKVAQLEQQCQAMRKGGEVTWTEGLFIQENLIPRGRIWFHIRHVEDEDQFHAMQC